MGRADPNARTGMPGASGATARQSRNRSEKTSASRSTIRSRTGLSAYEPTSVLPFQVTTRSSASPKISSQSASAYPGILACLGVVLELDADVTHRRRREIERQAIQALEDQRLIEALRRSRGAGACSDDKPIEPSVPARLGLSSRPHLHRLKAPAEQWVVGRGLQQTQVLVTVAIEPVVRRRGRDGYKPRPSDETSDRRDWS